MSTLEEAQSPVATEPVGCKVPLLHRGLLRVLIASVPFRNILRCRFWLHLNFRLGCPWVGSENLSGNLHVFWGLVV